ncbi:MAG: hypothetical protein C0624_00865 [Desulfuromonas sp.]|nr:MAG: hypothetical protein C0624_00865 [Desulfuromonas sp.]
MTEPVSGAAEFEASDFKIRRPFLIPLALLVVLLMALLLTSLAHGEPGGKIIILAVMIVPVVVLLVESLFRRIAINSEGVAAHKLLRDKQVRFDEVQAVDLVQVRKRAFVTLSREYDFLIISNAYERFPELVRLLLERSPETAISEETRKLGESAPVKSSDIVSCWLAVVLVSVILYLQFNGPL